MCLIDIPYVGRLTASFGKKLVKLAKSISPQLHIQPVPRPLPSIQSFFPRKDAQPKNFASYIVYRVNCKKCPASYIGMTTRQAERRFIEHGKHKEIDVDHDHMISSYNIDNVSFDNNTLGLRRSNRSKKIINYALNNKLIDDLIKKSTSQPNKPMVIKSAIIQHQRDTGHTFDWENWTMLKKNKKRSRLLILESLAIAQYSPTLNKTTRPTPLVIYPEGPTEHKPKVKIKFY